MIYEEFKHDWGSLSLEAETLTGLAIFDSSPLQGAKPLSSLTNHGRVSRERHFFKQAVLAAYDDRCFISGCALPQMLVASHIKPYSQCRSEADRVSPDNDRDEVFLQHVNEVCAQLPDKTVLVIGCGDSYVQLAARYKDQMNDNANTTYIPGDLLDHLINKEYFYKLCDRHGIDHPATVIYDKSMGHDFDLPWDPPYIAKPADGVAYWQHEFEGIKKVYICQSRQELLDALDAVYAAGYPDHMILQEFIPGDDTYMRVLTNYSDRNAQVKLMCLGHVLLEEHSPHGIGNHAVIITEHDEALCLKIKALLESLHYVGFSNFDIKYDSRDGKYKLFEINCRQGRSNYYVTGAGYNIAKLLVEDLVEHKELPFVITENESLWRMVPKAVAFNFLPKSYHPRMKSLLKKGAATHSLESGKRENCAC